MITEIQNLKSDWKGGSVGNLSELKKVELLEQTVLNKDVEGVKKILKEETPIEFTAKAIGLACRFVGKEMVEALLEGGATLDFELTSTLKRKYDCRIAINNYDDLKIDFTWYLFPEYQVGGYDLEVIPDDERREVLRLLYNKKVGCMDEILYYAILFGDEALLTALDELGVNEISEYRTDIVAGRVPTNQLDAYGRYDKREFQSAVSKADDEFLLRMLSNYLSRMKVDKITLFPSDFYTRRKQFITRFCSEKLFDFFVSKTSMVQKVKKWELLFALIDQNNAEGIQYALTEKWISKPKDIDSLLAYALEKENVKPELMGYILEKQNISNAEESKKKKAVSDEFSLDAKPLSVAEMKKIWGYKKQEDGTLIITSYKGEEKDVVIPSVIGKDTVTAIDANTFNSNAPRITVVQKKARREITSVEFPGTIKVIPKHMFLDGDWGYYDYEIKPHAKLKTIILNDGIEVLSDGAFKNCNGLESIEIPNSVKEIGKSVFSGCWKLKEIKLPDKIKKFTYEMFGRCGFESFEIPESVEKFEEDVFSNCYELKSIKLPSHMEEIPDGMFAMCKSLETIVFSKGVQVTSEDAFSDCTFEKNVIPDTVKKIGMHAFLNCRQMQSIVVPEHVKFAYAAFEGCDLLANDKGQIIINGVFFGVLGEKNIYMSAKEAVKPLAIGDEIKKIGIDRDKIPEIVYKKCSAVDSIVDIERLSVGDEVYFGRFPEKEDYIMKPLKWRVLDIVDGKALLITVDGIINQSYELRQTDIWKNAPVRTLLNEGFYKMAFTDNEREQIILTTNQNPGNKEYNVDGGPDTEDFVFLLSVDEFEKYMSSYESRGFKATEYARKQHHSGIRMESGYWLLRTPGKSDWGPLQVFEYGGVGNPRETYSDCRYLRPALWIKQKDN